MLCSMGGSSHTPKSRALGHALAEARGAAKLNQRQVASAIEVGSGTVARWETGERMPSADSVAKYLAVVGVTGDQYDEIMAMASGGNEVRWLAVKLPEQRAQMSAMIDIEATAVLIVSVSPLLVTGLLQTADYIRAIMSAANVSANEVGTRVAARIGRRDVITRRDSARLLALIGEAALLQVIGSPEVMVRQLRYLLEMAEYSNIEVRVVPFSAGWNPSVEGPFMLIEQPDGSRIVYLEHRRSGLILNEEEDVTTYQDAVEAILEAAMSPAASVERIANAISDLE